MNKHLVCLVIILTAACGCSARRGPAAAPRVSPLAAGSFAQDWFNELHLAKDNADELHLRGDVLFVYSQGDLVYGIGRRGGELRYVAQPQISGGTLRPPLLMGDLVIYPSGSTIEIFNDRGRPVKTIELEKPTRSGAVGAAHTIYLGLDHTGGTGVLASIDINPAYHNVNWEMMTFGAVTPTPAMFEKVIYCGSEDGRLYAVTEDRIPVWALPGGGNTFNTQGRFVSDLKVDDFGLYASNTDSKLYCIDRTTGRLKWQYYAGSPLTTAPVVFAVNAYQYVPRVGIVAIDKTTGQQNRQPKWIVKDAQQVLSEDQTLVYLKSRDGHILAVDKTTGQVQFKSKSKWDLFASNMTDAMIFAATKDGKVMAVRPVTKEGELGTVVMDFRAEPLAAAR